MSSSPPVSPTGLIPPPSYRISQNEFDQKTSQALQLSSSTTVAVDEDGWPIYDAAAFESVAESYEHEHSPPGSSSAGVIGFGAGSFRHERQERPSNLKLSSPTRHMKNRSSDRRRRNPQHDPEFPRNVTPPPPFTPTGPSLDGPPFEEVVGLPYSYSGLDSQTTSPLEPPYMSPPRSAPLQTTQPVAPSRLPNHRFSDPHIPTSSNTYTSRRPRSVLPDVSPQPNPSSMVTRVEFDPHMAYGSRVNHASMQGGASAFYNHAVAPHLATGPATGLSTQSNYPERVSSPYSSGYPSTPYWTPHVTPSMSHLTPDEPQHQPDFRFSTTVPSTHLHSHPPSPSSISSTNAGYGQQPSGTVRGPLPPVPSSNGELPHGRWARSEAQLLQDIYGGSG